MDLKNNETEHWMVLVFQLKKIAEEKEITHQQIADETGLIRSNVSRFFGVKYKPSLDVFLKIANVLGVTIKIDTL